MDYYIDFKKITIDDLKIRLKEADLLPSQKILKENIDNRLERLKKHDIKNLYDLHEKLKTKDKVAAIAEETDLPEKYLIILRREVNSYHPKPNNFKDFPGIKPDTLQKLEEIGIKHTLHIFDKILTRKSRVDFANKSGISDDEILELTKLTDVSRIKWVGPIFARLLIESGIDTVEKVTHTQYERLYTKLSKINEDKKYYKGKFGLNDMKLCVEVSNDVPRAIKY